MVPIIPGHLKTGLSGAKRLLSLALAYKNRDLGPTI